VRSGGANRRGIVAKHEIRMDQSIRDLGRVDLVLQVVIDGAKRGEIHISKGGVDWWPRNSKRVKHRWTWSKLADLLETGPTERL
jgi:hypothetical protein